MIVPNVSPNVGSIPDAFHVFFEVYNDPDLDSVVFVTTILNDSKEQVMELDTGYSLTHGRNQIFIRIDNTNLALGDYTLYIRAFPIDSSGSRHNEYIAATSRSIAVRWRGIPKGVKDLDLAIDQMQYIAESGELDDIRAAETSEEKQKRFLEFWKKRDPNPNTPRNEEMEEYYAKVEYANKHFRHYIDGWRTDMGMVYIIFGSPNNVDRHPFDIDSKPFEVWSYYELNHQFVFVDQTGFGDYRLTTPIWEIWKRPRY
jgi:GWxTD domain-containing protein